MNRILRPVIFLLATVYFLADAIFIPVATLAADWCSRHFALDGVRRWIKSLRPYPTLALFAVPVLLLEPVKLVAAYLAATGHIAISIAVLIVGEMLKLVLVEQLFAITRDKLMSIPAFAWGYVKFSLAKGWLESSSAWQLVRRSSRTAMSFTRLRVAELKSSLRALAPQSHLTQ